MFPKTMRLLSTSLASFPEDGAFGTEILENDPGDAEDVWE
jgi:hypothetical protein